MRVRIVSHDGKLVDPEVKLSEIQDVVCSAPTDGQVLMYDITTNKWIASDPVSAGGYVDRGDPSSWDFSKADLSTDGQWHTLDLSGIVPVGAALIHLAIKTASAYNDQTIVFVKNGIVNKFNGLTVRVPHGSNKEYFKSGYVACDAGRKVEYWTSPITWQSLDIMIRGWFT